MHEQESVRQRAAELCALAEGAGTAGSWSWRVGEGTMEWSGSLLAMFGGRQPTVLEHYSSLFHPDDRALFSDCRRVFTDEWLAGQTCRILREDGGVRWVRILGKVLRAPSGLMLGAYGVVLDLTRPADEAPQQSECTDLTYAHIRAARAWLGWTAQGLAEHAGVSFSTVRRLEVPGPRAVRDANVTAVCGAFARHGVRFVLNRDGSTGVVGPQTI